MSTPKKIDFDPMLFGEDDEEDIEKPIIRPKRNFWTFAPLVFVVVGIVVTGLFITKLLKHPITSREASHQFVMGTSKMEPLYSTFTNDVPVERQNTVVHAIQSYSSNSNLGCDGDETFCIITTTTKPNETLQKLISAIPQSKDKQYKVRLSVVPINGIND